GKLLQRSKSKGTQHMMNVGLRSNPNVTVAKTADTRLLVFWRPGKFTGVFVNGFTKSRTFHG
ncbi:MAG: hypothetical protein ACTH8J_04710, partial [Specibacter sp.]